MTEFTVDTDEDSEDFGTRIMESETHVLLELYRHLEGRSLFDRVEAELEFRHEHDRKLEHDNQRVDIEEALGL